MASARNLFCVCSIAVVYNKSMQSRLSYKYRGLIARRQRNYTFNKKSPIVRDKSNVFERSRRRANMVQRSQTKYKPRLATGAKFRTLLYCTAFYWITCRASQYLLTSWPNCYHSINKRLWGIRSTRILGLSFGINDSYLVIFLMVITN